MLSFGALTKLKTFLKFYRYEKPNKKHKKASIIIITHKNLEKNYNNLLSNLYKNKFILTKPTYIRIEKY